MNPCLDLFPSPAERLPSAPSIRNRVTSGASRASARPASKGRSAAVHQPQAAADLQAVLGDIFLHEEPAKRLLAVAPLVSPAHQGAWHLLTHTLLARRLELGSPSHLQHAAGAHTLAWAWARQWEQPQVLKRWQRLLDTMTARQCYQLAARASQHLRRSAEAY